MNFQRPPHETFFDALWLQYQEITPQATAIHDLFERKGETVVNDHVAFRTFADSPISLKQMEPALFDLGYEAFDEYHFEQKKLYAKSYNHPESDTKIFLSELLWKELSEPSQSLIQPLLKQVDPNRAYGFSDGRIWAMPSHQDYETLLSESEYAAWMSVWGLRANHFTVYVNQLNNLTHLNDVVALLKEHDYALNEQGGVIKGTEDIGLIQSSTLADKVEVTFACGTKAEVPSCYYEFAQRFKVNGELYKGFVTASADKIFESTHVNLSNNN